MSAVRLGRAQIYLPGRLGGGELGLQGDAGRRIHSGRAPSWEDFHLETFDILDLSAMQASVLG